MLVQPDPQADGHNHIFCFAALTDKYANTVYLDLTGKFPYMSLDGNQAILVVYDYTTNAILVEPVKNFESSTICAAYEKVFTYLESKGFKPQFNVLDNQASSAIKSFLQSKQSK